MSTIKIPLNSRKYPGLFALIDEADYELVSQYTWRPYFCNPGSRTERIYAITEPRRHGPRIRMHRLILGRDCEGCDVDHINHNGIDNRRSNLRVATRSQNLMNARKADMPTTSKYKGVYWQSQYKKWAAKIGSRKYRAIVGSFESEDAAARAYDAAAKDVYGAYAHLNFPNDPIAPWALQLWEQRKAIRAARTSTVRGVYWHKGHEQWAVQIKKVHYGYFDTEAEAVEAARRVREGEPQP